jgi:hypothetical protein
MPGRPQHTHILMHILMHMHIPSTYTHPTRRSLAPEAGGTALSRTHCCRRACWAEPSPLVEESFRTIKIPPRLLCATRLHTRSHHTRQTTTTPHPAAPTWHTNAHRHHPRARLSPHRVAAPRLRTVTRRRNRGGDGSHARHSQPCVHHASRLPHRRFTTPAHARTTPDEPLVAAPRLRTTTRRRGRDGDGGHARHSQPCVHHTCRRPHRLPTTPARPRRTPRP